MFIFRLLDPTNYLHYDVYLKVYANILYRWGLRNQSAGILKHVTIPPEGHSGIGGYIFVFFAHSLFFIFASPVAVIHFFGK